MGLGGYTTHFSLSPAEKIAVFVMTNADDGSPSRYTNMTYKLLAPVIKMAVVVEKPIQADPAWKAYAGKYRDIWGDCQVMVYNDRLVVIYPQSDDPVGSMLKLTPESKHTFRIEGPGLSDTGELLVFEMKAGGTVERMKMGENYIYPIK